MEQTRADNSDDPSYFGGYINDNYLAIADALDLSADELITIAKNSFLGAFITPEQQAAFLAEIDRTVSA